MGAEAGAEAMAGTRRTGEAQAVRAVSAAAGRGGQKMPAKFAGAAGSMQHACMLGVARGRLARRQGPRRQQARHAARGTARRRALPCCGADRRPHTAPAPGASSSSSGLAPPAARSARRPRKPEPSQSPSPCPVLPSPVRHIRADTTISDPVCWRAAASWHGAWLRSIRQRRQTLTVHAPRPTPHHHHLPINPPPPCPALHLSILPSPPPTVPYCPYLCTAFAGCGRVGSHACMTRHTISCSARTTTHTPGRCRFPVTS